MTTRAREVEAWLRNDGLELGENGQWIRSGTTMRRHADTVVAMIAECETMRNELIAFDEMVTLHAHYAELLNDYDGGNRLIFRTRQEWIARLQQLRTPPPPTPELITGEVGREIPGEETNK